MSTTTFPVSGSFGGRKSQPVRRAAASRPAVMPAPARSTAKRRSWLHFMGDAMAAWASGGRLPLDH